MADHAEAEYGTATGNDYVEHEATYRWFVHATVLSILLAINIMLGLAIGGVNGHWLLVLLTIPFAAFAAGQGLATGSRTSSYVAFAVSVLAFAYSAT